jgi:hypothetical protein
MRRGDVKRRGPHVTIPPEVIYIDDNRRKCATGEGGIASLLRDIAGRKTKEQKLRAADQPEDGFFAWLRTSCATRWRPFFCCDRTAHSGKLAETQGRQQCHHRAPSGAHKGAGGRPAGCPARYARADDIGQGPDYRSDCRGESIKSIEVLPLNSCVGRNWRCTYRWRR